MNIKKQFMWAVRSSEITPTSKNLKELSTASDLFSMSMLDPHSENYIRKARSFRQALDGGFSVVTYPEKEYPDSLRHIAYPPPVLYIRGNKNAILHGAFVGMVGSRLCDVYGMETASKIAAEIAQTGIGIVSGGAEGVDAASHSGALRANGVTVAVMGCGLDVVYPPKNRALFDAIVKMGGAIISEFDFGAPPDKKHFPRRNRIIAALADSLIVVQASARSGSLITANKAIEMGKTIYAVPGNIDNSLSVGVNRLIADGAVPYLNAMDVIDELISLKPDFFARDKEVHFKENAASDKEICPDNATKSKPELDFSQFDDLSDYEKEIITVVEHGFSKQNEIEEHISFEPSRLVAMLGMLELRGILTKGFDKNYKINYGGNG